MFRRGDFPRKVSLSGKHASLEWVFEQLQQQTGYMFLFNDQMMAKAGRISIQVKDAGIEEVLRRCFENQPLTYTMIGKTIIIKEKPVAVPAAPPPDTGQLITVSGKVRDRQQSLPGVSVILKSDPKKGVVTDAAGQYQIRVPANGTLIFSSVGYKTQETEIRGESTVNTVMEAAAGSLGEVVVVGYGTQKKVSVTGAISSLPVKEILQTATPSLSNAISGKLPGIISRQAIGEPGYDAAQVYIRGLSTWVNAGPLVLIDGVERDMNNINAQEIESFTILKDASATAVYGVRGANGVILINTKRGKAGKPQVTLRTESAMLTAIRLPKYINSFEYASLMNEARAFAGRDPRWTAEELEKFRTGSDPYLYPDVDWADAVLKKNTYQTINNLSVNGGNNFIRYFTNVGFTLQNGLYKEDKTKDYHTNASMKRYNFRSNVDINLSPSLVMQLGLGGIIQNGNYPGGGSSGDIFHSLRVVPPIAFPVRNPDGTPGTSPAYPGGGLHHNPWGKVTQSGYNRQDRSTLQGNFVVRWDLSSLITSGLAAQGKFSYDRYSETDNNRRMWHVNKQYTGKDPVTGEDAYNLIGEERPMEYWTANSSNRALYTELQLTYDRTFDRHNVTGMLLFNQRDYVNLNAWPSVANLPYRQRGLAGRVTYSFDDRYLAEFDFGYNGSENFAKGNRFGFFPSISGGWVISKEKFWQIDVIDHLKIRASHGQVGNDQVGGPRYLFQTTMITNGRSYRFGETPQEWPGIDEDITGNPDVTWEVATKTNLGLDLGLFKSKVTLQIDAFRERRTGILMQRKTVPDATGFAARSIPYGNIGIVKNQGLDALLEGRQTTTSGFFYSYRANFTYAHNEVVENDEPPQKWGYQSTKGKSINQTLGLVAEGLYQSQDEINKGPKSSFVTNLRPGDVKYKDVNGDGIIDSYDMVAIGFPRTPEIIYGFGGTVAYKGFDMSVYFTGAARTSIFLDGWGMQPFWEGEGTNNVTQEYYYNRWTPDHRDAKYPAIDVGHNPNNFKRTTQYMRSGNFLRLKNMEIGYTLPAALVNRWGLNQFRCFMNGTNLYTWDKVKIMDPESDSGTGFYPLQRTLNIGLQVDFK